MSAPILALRGVNKSFGPIDVLHDINLEVRSGEVLCLLGDNGAGKSTLIRLMSGVHRPSSGTIEMDGKPIAFPNPRSASEAGIATVHQFGGTFPLMSIGRSFFVGVEPTKGWGPFKVFDRQKANEIAVKAVRDFGITRIDDPYIGTDEVTNRRQQERIMRTAKNDRVGTRLQQRPKVARKQRACVRSVQIARLHAFDQPAGRLCEHARELPETPQQFLVTHTLQGARGCKNADDATACGLCGRLHGRLDADDRQGKAFAQLPRRSSRRRIAGYDQRAYASAKQEIGKHERSLANEPFALFTVRKVVRVRDVDDVQTRHAPAHLAHDRQTTHAGIENAHGAVLGHAGHGLRESRNDQTAAMVPNADPHRQSCRCLPRCGG